MRNQIFLKTTCKKTNCLSFLIILFLVFFVLFAGSILNTDPCAAAQNKKSIKNKTPLKSKKSFNTVKKQKKETPRLFHVTSDTMISERKAGFVEFSGHARANDVDSVIKADSIKIFLYTPQEKKQRQKHNKQGNIKKIIASGNVKYNTGNKKAFSDRAVYTTDGEIIVLTGKAPIVKMGNSFVTGKKITLFRNDARVIVESGKKRRVEAIFNSEDRIKKTK
ncbi:MAG: hypothetical protein GWP10_12535 [Nitrospiraceae bacterium]|nr:hypothetical protein [Nitrospiraceae bacterium]